MARPRFREKNPQWKGGRMQDKSGYWLVLMPEHPDANRHGYVREHRIVMASTLGRPLLRTEVVDHVNGVTSDNRPENLTIMENDIHSREHRKIDRELSRLRVENRRLKSLLMTYLPDGSDISSLLELT